MLLKSVGLYLHSDDFDRDMRSAFLFRSCYISNYLTRRVRELGIQSGAFKGLLIQGRLTNGIPSISSEHNIIVPIRFDAARYGSLQPAEIHEFFIAMIEEGLERCAQHHRIPIVELKSALEDFRRGDYRNEWTHQKKLLRTVGLRASLNCSLDVERFRLTLKLEKRGEIIFEQQILETKPDEVIFAHRFKEVVLNGDSVVVKDKFGKLMFSIKVSPPH